MGTYKKMDKKGGGKAPAAAKGEPKASVPAKAPEPETALTKRAVPDYFDVPEDGDIGMTVEPEDLSTPLIKLVQPSSAESARGDVKPGHYLNMRTGEDLGDVVVFVPLRRNMKRIWWQGIDEGGGINCRSFDGKTGNVYGECEKCKDPETGIRRMDFGKKDAAGKSATPICTKFADYPCIVLGDVVVEKGHIVKLEAKLSEEPVAVIGFARTSYGASKILAQEVIKNRLIIYANVFAVSSKYIEGGPNPYFVSEIEWVGWTPKAIYDRIKTAWEELMMIVGSPELYTPETDHMTEEDFGQDTADESEGVGVEAEIVEPESGAEGPDDDLPF